MNVIISQALATGLPVITTRHSGLPEQVQDGKSGFLVKEGDYEELASKIIFLIEHPELWIEMGKNGRGHILKNYNLDTIIDRQVSIYFDILNSK